MKRRKILIFFAGIVSLLYTLSSCTIILVESADIKYVDYKDLYEVGEVIDLSNITIDASYSNAMTRSVDVTPAMVSGFDTTTVGLKELTIKFTTYEFVLSYRVVEKMYLDVSFIVEDSDETIASQVVKWGDKVVRPEPDPISGIDEFKNWYLADLPYDFNKPVEEDMVIVGKFMTKLDDVKEHYKELSFDAHDSLIIDMYPLGLTEVNAAYIQTIEDIDAAVYREEIRIIYEGFITLITEQPTYMDYLTVAYENYAETDYFVEDYAMLTQIYEDALTDLNSYVAGAPLPQYLYNRAVTLMEDIVTKEEDIALAATQLAWYVNALNISFYEVAYSAENLDLIEQILVDAEKSLSEAIGTKTMASVYAEYVSQIKAVEKLLASEEIIALYTYFTELNEGLYFEAEWLEIVAIYSDALDLLQNYVGGAPMPAYLLKNVLAEIDDVVTMEEDIALAAIQLAWYVNDLKQSFFKIAYSAEKLALIDQILINAEFDLATALGTKAMANVYVAYLDEIKAVEKLPAGNEIIALYKYFMDLDSALYFEEEWLEIVLIYDEAMDLLTHYIGGAPMPAYLLKNTLEAIDDVVTIEEDLMVAQFLIIQKIKAIDAIVGQLDFELYTDDSFNLIYIAYVNIIEALYQCYGTRDIVATYNSLIDTLTSVNQSIYANIVLELRAYVEELGEENYTTEEWGNVIFIYQSYAYLICNCNGTMEEAYQLLDEAKDLIAEITTN